MIDFVLEDNDEIREIAKGYGFSNIIKVGIIKARNVNELKNKIKNEKIVIVEGGDDEINNAASGNRKVNVLLSPEKNRSRSLIYQRDAGLNHILCRKMRENEVGYGINLREIIGLKGKELGLLLGKIMQNIRLCRKYKIKVIIGSFARDKYGLRTANDIKAFGRILRVNKLSSIEILKREKDIILLE